nr:MAG TPA: hypothetical protein [Caudoviricetes sp.]
MFESIIASLMTGGLTLLGVIYTVRKQHDVTVEELRFEIRTIKKILKNLKLNKINIIKWLKEYTSWKK